ncbi:MAG: metal-dependent hydrolase [Vibrio sp.]
MTASGHYQSGVVSVMFPLAVCYKHQLPMALYLIVFIGCMLGVTAPDYLEWRRRSQIKTGLLRRKRTVTKTMLTHRGITHTLSLWITAMGYSYYQLTHALEWQYMIAWGFAFAYSYGGVVHLAGDLPNKRGIPLFPFGRKYALYLWKSSKYEWFANLCLGSIILLITLYYLGVHAAFITPTEPPVMK